MDKCTNLADEDGAFNSSDPYVKFELEQDNWVMDKNFGKQTSSKKQGDRNPEYGETFEFEVPSLEKMVLKVKVMDDDPGFDDKLGSCKIKLEDLGLSEESTGVERVIDNNIFAKDGRIYLKISYTE